MYFDFTIPIPQIKGKLYRNKIKETTYICYEFDRTYNKDKKYNTPKRTSIGKVNPSATNMMFPNPKYYEFFPEDSIPMLQETQERSCCLKVGAYLVIKKIIEDYDLISILNKYFESKEVGLFLDLVSYSLIEENNAGQYYPDYAYNHPLFSDAMHIYSDTTVSRFLHSITIEQSTGFLNEWNTNRDHREKIYISYDATNKNCQSGDIDLAEYGEAKADKSKPIFNYAVAYDKTNREPLFYEDYPGSIVDVSQLECMLGKAKEYGYRNVGFILDRGYFSKDNIRYMDHEGYNFVIMVKGMSKLVNGIILENKNTFEDVRKFHVHGTKTYGITVKSKLYNSDMKSRYFHLYYSPGKNSYQRSDLEKKLERMKRTIEKLRGKTEVELSESYLEYFEPIYYEPDHTFLMAKEREKVIENELKLCGYFCIITSEKMTADDALHLYKSRDCSEKLFRGDKSYLGNRSLRVGSQETAEAKIFVEFVAMIVRNRLYTYLMDEVKRIGQRENYMTVPAAIKELEKIEMVRVNSGKYKLDHAVSATQKAILKSFGIEESHIKQRCKEISDGLYS